MWGLWPLESTTKAFVRGCKCREDRPSLINVAFSTGIRNLKMEINRKEELERKRQKLAELRKLRESRKALASSHKEVDPLTSGMLAIHN
jgi:hypothetical protein